MKLWNPCHTSPPPSASVTDRGEKCKALHDRSLQRGCARFATTTAGRNGRTAEQPSADGRMEYDLLLYSSCPPDASCPLSEWRNERTDEGDGAGELPRISASLFEELRLHPIPSIQHECPPASEEGEAGKAGMGLGERRGCLPRHARHRRRAGGIRLDVSSEFRQRHTGS